MTEKTEHYFVVRVKLREMKAFNGNVLTKAGTIGWLCHEEGYPQISKNDKQPYHVEKFKTPPSRSTINNWNGMPWYCEIESAEVLEVKTYKKIIETRDEDIVAKY